MDPPRFLHQQHHRRYVPPPPLQHRHPPPLHENRHFFEPHHNNHHHHFTPPLPAPPQPPAPPSYRPLPALPPPPPYNPHQSQFTFRNPSPNPAIDENHHHHLDFNSLPSRTLDEDHLVPHRMPPKFDHFSDTRRRDVWDSPPRGLPENSRSIRAYPAVDLGHESRHHVFDRKPVSPYPVVDEFKHDSEGSSRFRDGYFPKHKDEFAWDGIEDCGDDDYRRDSHFVSNQDKSYKISGFGKSQVSDLNLSSRELAANLGNFESRYGSEFDGELFRYDREDGVSENQRWGCSRQPLRNLPDSSYMGNDGFRDGDDVRVFSGKNASGASEYGNFDRKGSRESTQEYDRTPRKQIQKKSAFLRIQMGKPSLRNRDGAQLQSLGYYVDSNSSPFRGKDTPVYSNRRNKEDEREREGSPVELDVSFKSNLLVAKPVVTPSGPAVSSGRNLTPNSNRKIRKLTYSDTDNSSSPEVKVSEGRLKSEISMHVNSPSNSVTDVKQSETKCTVSSGGSSSYICSKPLANGTNVSLGKRTVERSPKAIVSAKDGNNVGSGGKYLPKVTKKKVVKKVMIRRSSSSNAQPLNKLNEPGKAGSSTHGPSAASRPDMGLTQLIENTTSAGPVSGCSVDLQPSPNEVTMLPVNNKFDGSPQVLVSDEGGTKIEIGKEHLPDSDTVKKRISSKEEYHGLEGTTDRPVHLHAMSNPDSGLIEFQDNITFPEIDHVEDVCKQSVNNGISVELENDVIRVYPQATSTGYNLNIGLSGSEESKIYEVPVNSHSSSPVAKNELSTDNPLINYHENVTVSDVDTVDDGSKLPFANQVTESHEHGLIPGFLKDASLIDLSSSEENINLEGPLDLYRSNHGAGTELNSDYDLFNLQEKITVPNIGCQDHFWKQPCPDEVTISLENGLTEGSPTAMVSAGGNINVASGKECSPNKIRNRELRSPRWNSLSPSISNLCVGPLIRVGSGDGLDISTSTINNSRPANKEIAVYGVGDLDVVLELCTDGFHDLQRNVSLEGFSEEKILVGDGINGSPNRISHECKKKRKLFNSPTRLSGSTVSEINELPATADSYTSGAEVLLNSNNGLAQTGEIALSGTATVCTAGLASCLNGKAVLHENTAAGASFETLSLVKDGFRDDVLNLEQQSIDSGSIIKETAIPNMLFRCPLGIGNERTENATSFMVTTDQQYVNMVMESIREEETDVHYTGEQVMINGETTHCQIPLELQTPDSNQTFCSSDMECDSSLVVNDDFPSMSNFMSSSAYADGVSITDFTDEGMHSLPDIPSNMGSPEYSATASGVHLLSPELSIGQTSHEMVSGDDEKLKGKCVVTAGSDLLSFGRTSSEMVFGVDEKVEKKSLVGASTDHVTGIDHLFTKKAVPLPSQDFKTTTNCQSPPNVEANRRKNQAVPRMLPGRASIYFTNSGKTASSTQITKPRTWRRTGNPAASPLPGKKLLSTVPPLNQSSKKIGKVQTTSYIRKGNSLVRKPPLATALPQGSHGLITSVYRLSPSDIGELKKSTRSDGRVHLPDPSNFSGAGGMNAASQNPGPVTLPHSPGYCTSSPLTEPVISDCSETTSEPKLIEDTRSSEDAPKFLEISENQCVPVKSFDSQGEDCDNLVSLNMSKIIYVKRKSNQLVAATSPCNPSVKDADKTHASFSDGFYKRKRNQLIRTALESPFNQQVAVLDDSSNSKGQMAHTATSSRSFSKRWSDKVVGTSKLSKSSLVWTLRGAQSSKEIDNSMQHQKVLPHLFPWKRGTYWKKFRHNSATISSNSTSSMISKKLSLFRNRGAVYTRSTHGFSLRKSKVLSVGGRSLKWSISIEKRSKKANEEATLAVAAAERKKREENGAASVMYGVKTRNHSSSKSVLGIKLRPGERIYRIGSVRYKMDASKRTLQRISADDDTSFSAALQGKDVKKSYVPRRLVIGNDEYVRIGNGNQLIRDPKKRTRTLANEKVRWSLHTARLRLAKKRKYCQFFTRFGKCNKDNGKCPYIHDPSKIAVCTKFLKGLCSNPNCKLTHKVIPERMQDCSYFLQGLCSNENCPYRHVNVNPNSSTCEGFLRGYCADGNECRKKHSYVCPVFEASGLCPEGSKCKLHHPKRKSEGKKKKRLREQNAQGRYFGSPQMDVVEREGVAPEKHSTMNNDDLILADYISLDDSDEETGETMDLSRSFDDSDSLDGQVDNLDELVKPVRLMNNNLTT